MKAQLLFLAALVALAPSVEAQDEASTLTYRVDPDQFTMQSHIAFTGTAAAEYRQRIEERHGNGDGTLTTAEIARWKDAVRRSFTRDEPECFTDFRLVRLDGQGPVRVSEISVDATDAEGPTNSQARLWHSFFMLLQYRTPSEDSATATVDLSGDTNFEESTRCYLGYSISGSSDESETEIGSDFVLRVHPIAPAKILRESVRPVAVQQFWDGEGLAFDDADPRVATAPDVFTFTVGKVSTSGTVQDVGLVLGLAAGGTVTAAAFAALLTEYGRYHFLKALFLLPGFSRVQKDAVLEHGKREELYNFIRTNQGPSFSDLRRSLDLSNGNLIHHLRILEMQGYVTGQRDGFRKRFYIRGPKVVPTTYLTRTQQQLLDAVGAQPGLTQKELSALVGLPRELVFYHTKQLAQKGWLEIRQDGNRRRYWLRPRPAATTGSVQSLPT